MLKLKIKAARVNAGMKSKDVAKVLKLSQTGYAKKENGQSRFFADELATLSVLFNVPYQNFFEASCLIKDTNINTLENEGVKGNE